MPGPTAVLSLPRLPLTAAGKPRPWMDADLALYRDTVRRFVAEEVTAQHERWAPQQVDRRVWAQVAPRFL